MEPLPPPSSPRKVGFWVVISKEKPTKNNNDVVKPMEKPTKPKKTTFSKLWSLCLPPSSSRKVGFWAKVVTSKEKPTKTNNDVVKPMEKPTKPKTTTFSQLWSLCLPPLRPEKLVFEQKLLFPRGGSYIRTSVCEVGGLFVEEVGSYIKGPCPENRRALT